MPYLLAGMVIDTHDTSPRAQEKDSEGGSRGFQIAHLSGDSYQLGLAHGRTLAPQLRFLHGSLHRDVIQRRGALLGWGAYAVMRGLLARMQQHVPARFRDEARGVADAAGVPYHDVLLLTCFDDLIHNLQFVVPVGRLACSAIAAEGSSTPDGRVLLARNLDYYPETDWWGVGDVVNRVLRQTVVVFVIRPARGHAFVSIGWPGFVGTVTGINEAGLAVACLTSTVPTETADGEPAPLLYRRILEEAETLADCEAILCSTRRTIGNNLLVASARDNASRVFEFSPRLVAKRRPVNDRLAVTNHFQHPAMAVEQAGVLLPNSLQRLARLRELIVGGEVSLLRAQRIISDHSASRDSDCIANQGTIYSAIIEPSAMRLWLRCSDDSTRSFCELDVAALLKSTS